MKVVVDLISPLSVATGCAEPFTLELEENASGRELIRILSEQLRAPPPIHRAVVGGGLMLLVNQEYATPDTVLKEGDRVSVVLRISAI